MINIDINQQKDCFNAIRDFDKNGGKTYQVTQDDITAIQDRWGAAKVQHWRQIISQASQDVVNYQLTDDETDGAYNAGKQDIEDEVGYERTAGKSFKQNASVVADAGGGVVSGGLTLVNGASGLGGGLSAVSTNVGNAVGGGNSCLSEAGSGIIGCAIAAGLALLYRITNPNKEEGKALEKMQAVIDEAGASTANAQADMEMLAEEIEEQSEEADEINADHQEEIYEYEDSYEVQNKIYTALQEKVDRGEQLTEEEQMMYGDSAEIMTEAGTSIDENSEEAAEEVGEISGDMETSIEGYDDAAATIADTQAKVDVSASFDETTQRAANVEKISQYANAAGAGASAVKALGEAGWWGIAAAAVGAAAAASDVIAAGEQGEIATVASTEIDKRTNTDKLNQVSSATYDTNLENSTGDMEFVQELELETPDDVEAPEGTEPSGGDGVQQTADSGLLVPPEEENEEA